MSFGHGGAGMLFSVLGVVLKPVLPDENSKLAHITLLLSHTLHQNLTLLHEQPLSLFGYFPSIPSLFKLHSLVF